MEKKNKNIFKKVFKKNSKGFSLIEILVGVALISIALVGLAQLFLYSIMNNLRANQLALATFLAQQQIDYFRTLTPDELAALPVIQDEQIDVNADGTMDFRRITQIQRENFYYKVLIFPSSKLYTDQDDLMASPDTHQVKAQMSTIINR